MKTLFDFENPRLSDNGHIIHRLLRDNGNLTINEISDRLGYRTDTTRFRIFDLKKSGLVSEGEKRRCTVTGFRCKTYHV